MSEASERQKEINKSAMVRPNSRPMGYVFPKRIKQAMHGENPVLKSYNREQVEHKVVDTLDVEDTTYDVYEKPDGMRYIKRNGANVDVRIFQDMGVKVPMFCPKCGKSMKGKLDEKFFWLRGTCHVCVAEHETTLKATGLFEEYENDIILKNQIAFYTDAKDGLEEALEKLTGKNEYINEDGTIEKWSNDITEVRGFLTKELDEVKEILEKLLNPEKEVEE